MAAVFSVFSYDCAIATGASRFRRQTSVGEMC
jgi:hypothetical protein